MNRVVEMQGVEGCCRNCGQAEIIANWKADAAETYMARSRLAQEITDIPHAKEELWKLFLISQ